MIQGLIPDPGKRLTHAQIRAWNAFVGPKPTGDRAALYQAYVQKTGDRSFSYEDLNNELEMLRKKVAARAEKNNNLTGADTYTGNRFPELEYEGQNLGPVNGDERTETTPPPAMGYPKRLLAKSVPKEVDEVFYSTERNLPYYIDPHTGDITYMEDYLLHHPRFRASEEKIRKDLQSRGLQYALLPK